MYRIKQDQRTIRSCQLIYDALAELTRKKPFSKITVTDVVTTAQVGRTTFYRCFDEIEDVLRMRCDQVFDDLMAYLKQYRLENIQSSMFGGMLKPMLRYFYLNSGIIDLLLQTDRLDILQKTFHERAKVFQPLAAGHYQVSEAYLAYAFKIRVGVMSTILAHWVETGKQEAPDDLADTLTMLMEQRASIIDFM